MKVVIVRENLKKGLGVVDHAIGDGSSLPILRNILIEAADNKLILSATNLEIGIRCNISAKVIEKGRVSIPASLTSSLVTNLHSERLNLERKGVDVIFKTDNYEAVVRGLPAEEFPITPKIKTEEECITTKGILLKDALSRVVIATQFSEFKPELNSVLFNFSIDSLKLAATDNFRLAEKTITATHFETNTKNTFQILIPLKTCQEVLRIVGDDDDVRFCHDSQQVLVKTNRCEIISRLIDANFPNYEPIIPKKTTTEVVIDREELISAVKLVGVFGGKTNEAHVRISHNKKTIELSSGEQATGENRYVLAARVQGNDVSASFNWHHLYDGLRALKDDVVHIGMNDDNKPALIRSPKETSYFYILAPLYPRAAS